MKYIAIDIGSTFTKAVVLDIDSGALAASAKSPTLPRLPNPNPRVFENDANGLAEGACSLIDDFLARFNDIAGVFLSTQMHGFVYSVSDRKDIYVSWQDMFCLDSGTGKNSSWLSCLEEMIPRSKMQYCGVYIKPSLGFCNLWARLQSDTTLPRDGELFTLGSYIIHRLTGNNICHISNAAPLGLVNIQDRIWDKAILHSLNIEGIKLPVIASDDFQVCGEYSFNGRRIPIYPDWGDQQTAVLGCHAEEGDAVINIATASQVIVPCKGFEAGPFETRPYFGGSYFRTISNMPSGRGLDVFINIFRCIAEDVAGRIVSIEEIWNAVNEDTHDSLDGLEVDVTGIYPVSGRLDGGSIRGIHPHNLTPGRLFTAAFNDMARTYWKHIQILRPAENIRRLICAGGVSWKSPNLLKAIARESAKETRLSPVADEAVNGFWRAALMCSGKAGFSESDKYPLNVHI